MKRRPNTQQVNWFLEIQAHGQLDLDPAYQRRSVWNDSYRRYYIDTVLHDFPSPSIYLQVETHPGSPTVYHVIDGKQRLESLLQFSMDAFHLGKQLAGEGLGGLYYSQLSEDWKRRFVGYVLNVEEISDASDAELTEAFDRLNRNVARLNSQELRNARFDGAFISKAMELSAQPFWTDIGLATRSRVQRMLDVEFVSDLYFLIMTGTPQDGKASVLDLAYAEYDDEIPLEEDADRAYTEILEWLSRLQLDWKHSRWSNQTDHYSLWAALVGIHKSSGPSGFPSAADATTRLQTFEAQIDAQINAGAAGQAHDDIRTYLDAARQGSNKDTNRAARAALITRALLDPAR